MRNKLYLKILICLSLIFFGLFFLDKPIDYSKYNFNYSTTIHRDNWGVPHIYGKNDNDVAFGLAYAHAEDDFETIFEILIASRGISASVNGRDDAPIDYLVGLLKIWETVDKKKSSLKPETIDLCNAYADGINQYIIDNKIKISKDIFPIKGLDIIAGFTLRTPLMFKLDWYITELMKDKRPNFLAYKESKTENSMYGSNVIAVAPSRSADKSTRIAINSHQPWEGPVTWYEAHLHSDEGWNASGGLFPGSPVILKGYNENISWSHTVNKPDLVDVYELTINPENKYQYQLDDNWIDFEVSQLPIRVKLFGPFYWTVKREILYSKHGPVIETNHGTYAVRYSGHGLIGQVEQWYNMNKSHTLEEFQKSMEMMQIPMFNTMFADKYGNIFYIYNALLPKRKNGINWKDIVPGNFSDLIWTEYYTYGELPSSLNPKSGYLQNCNSTPYSATVGRGNPLKTLPKNCGIEEYQTNRAFRSHELYGKDESITKEEFYAYKYDTYYSKKSVMNYALNKFIREYEPQDEKHKSAINVMKNWDLGNQKTNRGAAIAQLTFDLTYDIDDFDYNFKKIKDSFIKSTDYLIKEFGRVDVELGKMQIIKRGDKELPLDGGPDLLRAIYSKMDDNRKVATGGDCFFQIVEWDENGNLSAESIHQFGSATLDKNSIHYNDQSVFFSNLKMKPSFIYFDQLKPFIKKSYNP